MSEHHHRFAWRKSGSGREHFLSKASDIYARVYRTYGSHTRETWCWVTYADVTGRLAVSGGPCSLESAKRDAKAAAVARRS